MNSPQPCEAGLDRSKPTRLEGWKVPARWKDRGAAPAKGKEYPGLGFKKLRNLRIQLMLITCAIFFYQEHDDQKSFVKLWAKGARHKYGITNEVSKLFVRVVCKYGLNSSSSELRSTPLEDPKWRAHMAFHRHVLTGVPEGSEEKEKPVDPDNPDAPPAITRLLLHRRILGLADKRAFQLEAATQMGMGLDPGAIQAVSATSGWWNDNIKLELQHLAAATPAIQRHVAVTLATWDTVWGEYLHPKWAEQRMRLYGAQEKVLERYFKKVEVPRGTRKQLVVFFGNAGIGSRGGWGAKAVLQACRKVVERPNSGRPTERVPGKVVTVDEFCTSRVSSAMNSPQPCEAGLDRSKLMRPEGWSGAAPLVAVSLEQQFKLDQATPGDLGKWVDRDCNAALNLQRAGESKWRPLELCRWRDRGAAPAKGKEYPGLGFKKLRDL
ncbi:hypothetical protein QJQ45_010427 [Haematococcus lacustris]|nr:hypothetical protein QJQ45_010427 [Haematococcus lacustris]